MDVLPNRGMFGYSKTKKKQPPDHVPGELAQAASQVYAERGSAHAIEASHWRYIALLSSTAVIALGVGLAVMAGRSSVQVMQVSKDEVGNLQVRGVAEKFAPDEQVQMVWASDYARLLTEVSPVLWKRNVEKLFSISLGTAAEQARTYLRMEGNNPPLLLSKRPFYVREYHRKSVNKLGSMSYLVRYELVTRPSPSEPPEKKAYAMTISLANVGHKTEQEVFNNPAGLAAASISISGESGATK